MFRLMFDCDSFGDRTEALRTAGGRGYRTLVDAVRAIDPAIDEAELNFRVTAIWSIVHGTATLMLEGQIAADPADPAATERLLSRTLRAFLAGLER